MTWKKFFFFFLIQWLVFAFTKVWLLTGEVFSNGLAQGFLFLGILFFFSIALCRRFGVISFAEAFFVFIFWSVGAVFLDLIFTSNYTGLAIFKNTAYWTGYGAIGLGVMFFHKMRHLHVRHQMHAAKHAHGHGADHKSHGDHHQQQHGQQQPGKHH